MPTQTMPPGATRSKSSLAQSDPKQKPRRQATTKRFTDSPFLRTRMSSSSPSTSRCSSYQESQCAQSFAHPPTAHSRESEAREEEALRHCYERLSSAKNSRALQQSQEMRQVLLDNRGKDEDRYGHDGDEGEEPFFTSITESVSCSSEEAATQGMWPAAREVNKRTAGRLFSRRLHQYSGSKYDNRDEENEHEIEFHYSPTDQERDNIWATDDRDGESVEVFSLPTDMKVSRKQQRQQQRQQQRLKSIPHHSSLNSATSHTTSTWMHETVGSGSLLDDDDSLSTTSSGHSSSFASFNEETESQVGDDQDNETVMEDEDYGDEFLSFNQPVESFLHELAENKSIRKIGNYVLSQSCFATQGYEDEIDEGDDDHYDDDDDDDDDTQYTTPRRGRSRSPRRNPPPGIKLLYSLVSSADSIWEAGRNEPFWRRMFECTSPRYEDEF